MPCYTRDFLASRNCIFRLPRILRRRLFYFGILLPTRLRYTGTYKALHSPPSYIPVRISLRAYRPDCRREVTSRTLRSLPPADRHVFCRSFPLSFGLLNVRSLNNKVDDVLEIRRELGLEVLLLVETWHDPDSSCINRLRREGLCVAERSSPRLAASEHELSSNHGGVAIIGSASLLLSSVPVSMEPTSFEVLCVRVSSRSSCVVVLIYRTGPITSLFFEELTEFLDLIVTLSTPVIVAGDFNIHVERLNDSNASRLLSIFRDYGYCCRVNSPTHNLGGTLDVIFTSCDLPSPQVTVHETGLSDHSLLRWNSTLPSPCLTYRTVTYRPWKLLNICDFRAALHGSPICDPESWSSLDANELACLYDSSIADLINRILPVKTIRCPKRPTDPWFDSDCRLAKRSARQLERSYRRALTMDTTEAETVRGTWRCCLRRYRSLLMQKRSTFWRAKLHSERHDARQLWRSFDVLMGRGRVKPADSVTADTFLEFFLAKASAARSAFQDADPPTFSTTPGNSRHLRNFQLLSVSDTASFIRRLPNKSSECDPLPTHLLKCCSDLFVPFLTELFNRSLSEGVFPSSWKRAYISPILKKSSADPHAPGSYRPISKLSTVSKLLERIVFNQLSKHVDMFSLLPNTQSAYRSHFSTETAVLKFLSDSLSSFDKGEVILATFLDLSSAFDCVDHSILLRRLNISVGLRGPVLRWFESFLTNRFISVHHGHCTPFAPVVCGVPQGSVLGPLLFSLFISDLAPLVSHFALDVHLFADDILLYGSSSKHNLDDLSSKVSLCLDDILYWLKCNKLSLNIDKTNFMWCYSSRLKPVLPSTIRIGNLQLLPVSSASYLGARLDKHLLLSDNVSKTSRSCFAMLRRIRSISYYLPMSLVKSLVVSLVLSRLDYLIVAHAGLPRSTLWRLQRVLHAAARISSGASRFDRIQPLLHRLNWLPIQARIEHRLATLAFNCRHGLAPSYLSCELKETASSRDGRRLRSASSLTLLQPRVRCPTLGGRAFPLTASRAWNSLPAALRCLSKPLAFKHMSKAFFIEKYLK